MNATAPLPRRAWLALALATALGGCGPGVGGSGTGLEPDQPPGTALLPTPSLHADAGDGRQVQAVLDGGRLRADIACPRLRFDGRWDGVVAPVLRFEGTLDGDPSRRAVAELRLDGSTLELTLRDTSQLLLGAVRLPARMALPPLAGC